MQSKQTMTINACFARMVAHTEFDRVRIFQDASSAEISHFIL